jgi:flagellar hook-associated protein 3 FlgL
MKTAFISTYAVNSALRASTLKLQTQLVKAQTEVTTGVVADVGLALGATSKQSVSIRQQLSKLNTITDTNNTASTRLTTTNDQLANIQTHAQNFLNSLLQATDSGDSTTSLGQQGGASLQALIDSLNTSISGEYIFGGINADVKPLSAYDSTSASKTALDNAFQTAFGVTQSDPAVSSITGTQMQSFLDTTFANLYTGAQWSSNWSSASSDNIKSRISNSELIETSVNVNDSSIQKLAQAYTMMSDLGNTSLDTDARHAVVSQATTLVGQAITGLINLQTQVGIAQSRVTSANSQMSLQIDVLKTNLDGLEGVDAYQASTLVNSLQTQIEASYSLTSKLQQLSILNYL